MARMADCNPLGEVFYRKQELYSMGWADQIDLSKFMVATAPYGGPIALIRNEPKAAKSQPGTKPIIYIFNAAGREISSIRWNSGRVLTLGWSATEDLLCVQDDGAVLVYDIHGEYKRNINLGQEAKDHKVLAVRIFNNYSGTGVAVLTTTYRIFVVNNVDEPRIRRLAEIPGLDAPPSCWAIINQERQTKALVAKDTNLYLVDHGGQYEQQYPQLSTTNINAFIEMAVSFNNKFLALLTDTGLLWIGSTDMSKVYCEFDTKSSARPTQLVWCGSGAIVGYWENILLMVGPKQDWVKYSQDTPVHLVPEVDGLRIIGSDKHEFLGRVPGVVEEIFKIGSVAAGACLLDASREFQRGTQKADEYIRMIKDSLAEAVEQCVEAAGHEYETAMQKELLRAASFGKCFLTDYKPESFVNMCQMLRVLNAVREYTVGLPLTYLQLEQLTLPVLMDRLVLRRHYCLAIRICQYLKLPEAEGSSRILAHWACYKVQSKSVSDDQVAMAISQKLGDTPGVSYSEIANRAIECGRTELAIKLLNFEAKAGEQVPLLMKMKRDKLALAKAIESGDTDLVYTVLLHLKEDLALGEFFMLVRSFPSAHALFLQFCRQQNRAMLRDLYYQEDAHQAEADCRIQESYEEERIESRLSQLQSAQEAYVKARNDWAAKETEDEVRLLKNQRRLEEELHGSYLNLSLQDTIAALTREGNHKLARQMRKEFKVPDRRFWWLRIAALGEAADWGELDRFAKSQKSPIGYEPFLDVCLKNNNKYEAEKYLPKVLQKNKVRYHIKLSKLEEAAEIALQNKNEQELKMVADNCDITNQELVNKIKGYRAQLGVRR